MRSRTYLLYPFPFDAQGVSNAAKASNQSSGPVPFRSSVVPHEQLGLSAARDDPHVAQRMIARRRPKKSTAFSRHKQWLKSLSKGINEAREQAAKDAEQAELKYQRLAEQQARFRSKVRGASAFTVKGNANEADAGMEFEQKEGDQSLSDSIVAAVHKTEKSSTKAEQKEKRGKVKIAAEDEGKEAEYGLKIDSYDEEERKEEGTTRTSRPKLSKAQQEKIASRSKPMWAYTAEGKEQEEEEEAEELVDFAKSLNIDEYLDDLELKASLETVKERVKELAAQKKAEQKKRRALERQAALEHARREREERAKETGEGGDNFFTDDFRGDDAESCECLWFGMERYFPSLLAGPPTFPPVPHAFVYQPRVSLQNKKNSQTASIYANRQSRRRRGAV